MTAFSTRWASSTKGTFQGGRLALLLGLALGVAGGCGEDAASTNDPVCRVGDTRECLGPGACKGAQECREDGSGFQPCECGGTQNQGGEGPDPTPPSEAGSGGKATGGAPGTGASGAPGTDGVGGAPEGGAGGGSAVEYECHPVGNVGCDATQNCSVDAGEPACVNAGAKAQLEACTQTSECGPGLICHFNNCLKACAQTADCGAADASIRCAWTLDRAELELGPVGGCVRGCNPITQDCPNGQACYLGACMTPTLARAQGDTCRLPTDCDEGLECLTDLDGDAQNDCSEYCSTAAQDPCGEGRACFAINQAFPNAPADWGLCVAAQ